MPDLITGPSGGVLGKDGGIVSREVLEKHPDLARQFVTIGQHPRAGHDRERWKTVRWDDYRAHVGIQQQRGPWRVEMAESKPGSPDQWTCEAAGMPFVPGWYTTLVHATRGLVMSDLPAEIAGCLPFLDRVAAVETHRLLVLIAGLGLGIVPAWLLASTSVLRIDVIEIDPDLIGLITEDPAAMDDWAADPRLHIHLGDAHTWKPRSRGCVLHQSCASPTGWDAAWFDIWDIVSAANLPSMHRLHRRFARRAGWAMSWERPECEAMRARGQTLDRPGCLFINEAGYPALDGSDG